MDDRSNAATAEVPHAVSGVVGFVALLLAAPASVCASSIDAKPADQDSISALEARIHQAQPREQCYLYAELIHQMTEFSLQQYSAGDVEKANDLLNRSSGDLHARFTFPSATTISGLRTLRFSCAIPPSASTRCCTTAALKIARWWSRRWRRSIRPKTKP